MLSCFNFTWPLFFLRLSLFTLHSVLPQVQPQIHQSASPSHLRSHQGAGLGLTSALSVMRTWWTQSSTPVGTCVCATLVASNSRRCPTLAVQSAEDRSKILSRPTAARKGGGGKRTDGLLQNCEMPESWKEKSNSMNVTSAGTLIWYFHTITVGWFSCMTFSKADTISPGRSLSL